MFKLLSTALFSLLVITLSAQTKSNLTISTTGTSNLKIIFNGYKYSLQDRSTTFQGLSPGNYPLVIYQWRNLNGSAQFDKVYEGNVRLTAGKHLEMTVMRFGKTSWDESGIEPDNWNENYNNPPVSEGNGNPNQNNSNWQTADANQFAAIKKAVSNEYFDEDKIRMAKVTMKDIYLTSNQIKELVNLLYSDDKKLILAKYAYDFCSDRSMYFTVAETLYFTNNKKALLDYIAGK